MGDLASSLRAKAYVKAKAKKSDKQAAHRADVAEKMKNAPRPTRLVKDT